MEIYHSLLNSKKEYVHSDVFPLRVTKERSLYTVDGVVLFLMEGVRMPVMRKREYYEVMEKFQESSLGQMIDDATYVKKEQKVACKEVIKSWFLKTQIGKWSTLADTYYDDGQYAMALDFYEKVVEEFKIEEKFEKSEKNDSIIKALVNIGLIYARIGEMEQGISIIEKAYEKSKSVDILLKLQILKIKVYDFSKVQKDIGKKIQELQEEKVTTDEFYHLAFLYYQKEQQFEAATTSFLQIQNKKLQMSLLGEYMQYSIREKGIESVYPTVYFLKDENELIYHTRYIEALMESNHIEEMFVYVQENFKEPYPPEIYICLSKAYEKIRQIIQSITMINQVDPNKITIDISYFTNLYYYRMVKLSDYIINKKSAKEKQELLIKKWMHEYREIYNVKGRHNEKIKSILS